MPDPITPNDTLTTDDAMPQGAARERAEAELDNLEPGPTETLHFGTEADAEQSIDEPMHDLLGRRDGP